MPKKGQSQRSKAKESPRSISDIRREIANHYYQIELLNIEIDQRSWWDDEERYNTHAIGFQYFTTDDDR